MIEREVKLGVWPGFELPDLAGAVVGITCEARPEKRLDATYFDTPDLRLARGGITLRHRTGDEPAWTLKLPKASTIKGGLAREELSFTGDQRGVPRDAAAVVTGWVRTSSLGPVARLQTVRRPYDLVDEDGERVAEIADDEVSVLEARRVSLRFREVEVELAQGAPRGLLDEVLTRLRSAGAGLPDPTPKVMRALGPRAQEPPDVVVPDVGADASAAEVLRAGIARSVLRLVEHDLGIRTREVDEDVHQARVATRRLRSDLRTYGELLDPLWAAGLRDELSWLADALGGVRDADVLRRRLEGRRPLLEPDDRPALAELVALVDEDRRVARAALLDAMASSRYALLLDALVEAAREPRVLPEADRPAVEVLPRLVGRPWAALAKSAERVRRNSPDTALHDVRIRAKRARYAAEVAALAVKKPAHRLAAAIGGLQEVLGEHQDACVAKGWLRQAAEGAAPRVALVAGQLIAVEQAAIEDGREAWHPAWRRASKGRLRAWLKP